MHLDIIAIFASFLLNCIISFYGIVSDKQAFSLNKVFWIFNLLFLSLLPFGQFVVGTFPWGRVISNSTILSANGLILLSQIIYAIVREKTSKNFQETQVNNEEWTISKKPMLWLYFVAFILLFALSDFRHFWQRNNGITINNGTLQLLTDKSLRGICLFGLLGSIYLWKEKKLSAEILCLVLLSGILANFPTAIPRYWLATFYMGALLVFFKERLTTNKQLFATLLLASTLVLFPLLSILRYGTDEIKTKFSSVQDVFSFSFLGGDFDAYSSMCSTINYVETNGITWGKQLLTVFLFFIPRSIWPGKSVGSGALVNHLEYSDFTNFSSPFIAEGYINFGIIGAVFFIAFASWFIVRYDNWYWKSRKNNYATLVYPVAIGMFFFMLRGDLLSSFAYSVGLYVSGWLCYKLCSRK